DRVCQAFAHAARRAREASFDGVQLHAAHGYLLSQFLSPFYNKRTDAYGGTIQNRARIALESLKAIRAMVGNDFAVLAKINSEDFLEGGLTVDDMLQASAMLEQAGIDAIELSGGTVNPAGLSASRKGALESESHEIYYREAARQFKQRLRVPLMLVGGIRSYGVAELLLAEGVADYIAMCRPFIREPDLINRWKSGDVRRAFCASDNACFKPVFQGRGIACVAKEKEKI
ncbi:MAG: NADH:flavin oxidoreductase/NADH oxidase, partial [Deltaproteobacteria bacterium]|nr:NADH:flavin oxidoreductase/NADH oxidase [Deltaproteobacteria bacterium]